MSAPHRGVQTCTVGTNAAPAAATASAAASSSSATDADPCRDVASLGWRADAHEIKVKASLDTALVSTGDTASHDQISASRARHGGLSNSAPPRKHTCTAGRVRHALGAGVPSRQTPRTQKPEGCDACARVRACTPLSFLCGSISTRTAAVYVGSSSSKCCSHQQRGLNRRAETTPRNARHDVSTRQHPRPLPPHTGWLAVDSVPHHTTPIAGCSTMQALFAWKHASCRGNTRS